MGGFMVLVIIIITLIICAKKIDENQRNMEIQIKLQEEEERKRKLREEEERRRRELREREIQKDTQDANIILKKDMERFFLEGGSYIDSIKIHLEKFLEYKGILNYYIWETIYSSISNNIIPFRKQNLNKVLITDKNYGTVNEMLVQKLKGINVNILIEKVNKFQKVYELKVFGTTGNIKDIVGLDLEEIRETLWALALNSQYHATELKKVQEIYDFFMGSRIIEENYKKELQLKKEIKSIDSLCAELCALSSVTLGNDLIKQKTTELNRWLEFQIEHKNSVVCENMASFLNWIKAYEFEEQVLEKMVVGGLTLNNELSERLQYLKEVGEDIISIHSSIEGKLAFEVASINWDNNMIETLFKSIVYKKKTLEYALAFREWKNTLNYQQIPAEFNMLYLFQHLSTAIGQEYRNQVNCSLELCVKFTGMEDQNEEGILITAEKSILGFNDVGLYLTFSNFGKKLNIRIYTLYIPTEKEVEKQRIRALIVKNNTDSNLVDFEEGIKDSLITHIQSIINGSNITNDEEKDDEVYF